MEEKIVLDDGNTKVYELLLKRNDETGEFSYYDFIRPVARNISEVKHEIRHNIAVYQMDKKVEELVNRALSNHDSEKVMNYLACRVIAAKIGWIEDVKMPVLLAVGLFNK